MVCVRQSIRRITATLAAWWNCPHDCLWGRANSITRTYAQVRASELAYEGANGLADGRRLEVEGTGLGPAPRNCRF